MKLLCVFLVVLIACLYAVPPVAAPMKVQSIATATYDLKDVKSPRAAGIFLRALKHLLQVPILGNIIIRLMMHRNGFYVVEGFAISLDPYIEPQYYAVERPNAAEEIKQNALSTGPQMSFYEGGRSLVKKITAAYVAGTTTPVDVTRQVPP